MSEHAPTLKHMREDMASFKAEMRRDAGCTSTGAG